MIVEHSRFEIWNGLQHPFKHSLADFGYANEMLPGVSNVESALNYFSAALYPVYKGSVATTADLPTGVDTPNPGDVVPTLNDYRVVLDDGDAKQAGYRWEQREDDVAPQWYKIYDVDWSTDGILASLTDITQDMYVFSKGKSDLDELGVAITGLFAGQRVWGGNLTTQNLTLDANSVDDTGFVQVNSDFRPTVDDTWDLGTATERFVDGFFSNSLVIDTMTISTGSIIDSSGAISFGDEDLTTSGIITGGSLDSDTFLEMAEIATPANANIGTNRLYFKSDDKLYKLTEGGAESLVGLTFTSSNDNRLIKSDGAGGDAIQESGIIVSDTDELSGITKLTVDSLALDGDTLSSTGNINLSAVSKTIVGVLRSTNLTNDKIQVPRTDGTFTSTLLNINTSNELSGATLITVDNLSVDGNTFSSTSGDLNLVSASEVLNVTGAILPEADTTRNLGSSGKRFANIFLSNGIQDATDTILMSDLMPLRSTIFRDLARSQAAQTGDSLFFDAVNNVWLASVPDSEISHASLSNLTVGDSGHTQFALLAGRSGGQVLIGGTGSGDDLTLESTSNATKGSILLRDDIIPEADATFSGGWNGVDLGADALRHANLYMRGEAFGLRTENTTTAGLPTANANNTGRLLFNTDTNKLLVDTGSSIIVAGVSKFVSDVSFDGIVILKNVDVSANIVDARNAIIQLKDNANDFENIVATIKATSASNVRIQTNVPLPAGSYRLIVME